MEKIRLPQGRKIFWVAIYGEEDYLCQYDSDNKEILFKNIDLNRLQQFVFVDRTISQLPLEIGVFPKDGRLVINGIDYGHPVNHPVKLIYFQRKRVELSIGPKGTIPGIPKLSFYGIGYEFKEKNGKVTKKFIKYKDHTIL